jgi:methyltransferase OMS1, mitochondrial
MSTVKLVGGTIAGLGSFWAVSQITAMSVSRQSSSEPSPLPSEQERKDVFSKLAPTWDATVRWDEFTSGIRRWRRHLISRAEGDVLEVAVGTGRNLEYYNGAKVKSLTCIDFSRKMLEMLLIKKEKMNANFQVKLKVGNCSTLDFPDNTFDTVVDTFGICSFEDPVSALREMKRVCKPNGKVLLLEHGESDWPWMQKLLASQVSVHVKKFGCYNHRNIEQVIAQAGLTISESKRKHWGTIYCIECLVDK